MRKLKCYSIFLVAFVFLFLLSGCPSSSNEDTSPPTVESAFPINLSVNVPINSKIVIVFSETMDDSTITNATFTIEDTAPVIGTITYEEKSATFTPTTNLAASTQHTATITNEVRDSSGNAMLINYVCSFTTGTVPDNTLPTVTSVNPENLAVDVPLTRKIAVIFSEVMNPQTINDSTFTIEQDSTLVAGTITYTGTTATFTPASDLAPSTLYTATITTSVKDLAANSLASNYVWSFTTGLTPDTTPPEVASVNPADQAIDVEITRKIAVTFDEAMDPLTITNLTFTIEQGITPVSGTVTYTGFTATFTPANDFAPSTIYTATITTGCKDLANNALELEYSWIFTTGVIPDIIAPTVLSVNPEISATDVPINSKITATFSEAMDPLTIINTTFTVSQSSTLVSGTVTYAGTVATFTPSVNLLASTVYTAVVTTGCEDLSENSIETDYTWTFTTGVETILLSPVALGQAAGFAVLAGYAVTNVPSSLITGDVGISPSAESLITGFAQTAYTGYSTSLQVVGKIYAADMASPTPAMLTLAKGDLTLAINDAAGRTPIPLGDFLNPGTGNLAGLNLVPGLYKFTGDAIATGNFTLTGGPNDVWIFQIAAVLNVSNGVQVTLAGGAKAENIFWQVGTQATIGTTVTFHGTIMASASITLNTGTTLYGRALAFSGTIALDTNVITK